jgi:putative (di)nucleoside polyphosphate hydrolase
LSKVPERYRRNVAIVIINDDGELLAGERNDVPGAWQLPQGGIEDGESVTEAMHREASEELGVDSLELIHQLHDPIRYEWPESLYHRGYRGQEQYYCLARFTADEKFELTRHDPPEFRRVKWMTKDEFLEKTGGFKKDAYAQALELLSRYMTKK